MVRHTHDYRSQCATLNSIKARLREMIDHGVNKNVMNRWVVGEFRRLGKVMSIEQVKAVYTVDDMILGGTNVVKDVYTEMFRGQFACEKYYVTENNRVYSNGDIVVSEDPPERCVSEVRHCFTVHSIQGETAFHKLFIDSSRMFSARMFYTAISRAKSIDQIYVVEGLKTQWKIEGKIYKISGKNGVYIGSTGQKLDERFEGHKTGFEKWKQGVEKYLSSYRVLEGGDAKIPLLEHCPCNSVKILEKREAELIPPGRDRVCQQDLQRRESGC